MSGFVKLYGTILDSSVWDADDATRLVWITMLAMADADGIVQASIGGLAHRARVSRTACERALTVLAAPDPDDRSGVDDGRRIRAVQGGWLLANHRCYREMRTRPHDAEAEAAPVYGHVYYAQDGGEVKIGFSRNPWARVAELRTARPSVALVAAEPGTRALERVRHEQFGRRDFRNNRRGSEWFPISPALRAHLLALSARSYDVADRSPVTPEAEAEAEAEVKEHRRAASGSTTGSSGTGETAEPRAARTETTPGGTEPAGKVDAAPGPTGRASAALARGNGAPARAPTLPGMDTPPDRRERAAAEVRVWDAWRRLLDHPRAVLDTTRRRRIRWAIETYGEDRAIAAIQGCAWTAWNNGDNPDGKRYDDVSLIFRDASHAERFLGEHDRQADRRRADARAAEVARTLAAGG